MTQASSAGGRLAGKVAIITGGASGIGAATVARFVAEGASVVVADLDGDRAAEVCAPHGDRAMARAVDVTDGDAVRALVDAARERFGRLDIYHNNAGVALIRPLLEITREEWDRTLAVNVTALFLAAQVVAPVMREQGGGSLLVTASIASRRPRPDMAAYVASKLGVTGLARQLALDLAPEIRVNVINPGPVPTPMLLRFGGDSIDAVASAMGDVLPLGRAVQPDDVASAAVYLSSDEASAVTGVVLNVDAGRDL
ncbi:glucose 1-dehydrogenase [Baekduia soli]|uniref:Glucose 1-dehydrogenase n=1 Tax=Baekduia soli TaxID=496014 RepID=A0A5B8U191_9ACTN|nr:glucose 1-dehydrogenase [Baekduia soli]QEC46761.1 glucose 1-dehydrogenase [Baekduia soli]